MVKRDSEEGQEGGDCEDHGGEEGPSWVSVQQEEVERVNTC